MNAIELLIKDDETVYDLFDRFDTYKELPEKNKGKLQKLYSTIKLEIEMHTAAEEQFFYPQLQHEDDMEELVTKSLHEHQEIRSLLSELETEHVDENWIAKMSQIKDNVHQHMADEENELFEKALEILDEDEIDMMGESITQLKKAA